MNSTNPDGSNHPEHNLTPPELDDLKRLEAIAQDGLDSYIQVSRALAEIRDRRLYRDSHSGFDGYVRERWSVAAGDGHSLAQPNTRADARATPAAEVERARSKPCEALARACEETLSALGGEERLGVEIRFAVRPQEDPEADALAPAPLTDALLPNLRWLMTQAGGTIADVAHQLETRAVDVDDRARAQLRDDVLVLEGELAVVKALLLEPTDWDSEFSRLLDDDVPPHDIDTDDAEDDE